MESIKAIARRTPIGPHGPSHDAQKVARQAFKDAMDHLAAAYRHELTTEAIRVYWHALKDVSEPLQHEGMARCAQTLKFFPTVAELRTACADIVDERRALAARSAKALQEDCPDCHGSGLRDVEGPNTVVRCRCVKRALELIAEAGEPLKRPALPAWDGEHA
jgi:hypothetical protein